MPGVGALLIGTGDLRLSMGVPLSQKEPPKKIEDAIQRVGRVARDCGKYAGLICTPEKILLKKARRVAE